MLDEKYKIPLDESVSTTQNSEKSDSIDQTEATEKPLLIESQEIKLLENKVIDEIDDHIAETSENIEHKKVEMLDYNTFTLEELVGELNKLIKENEVQGIANNINKIKSVFNVKLGEIIKTEKEKFLAEGGNIIDFQYTNPLKSIYNSYLYDYKIKRKKHFENQEQELNSNLQSKLELIDELKHLIDNSEGASMYKLFKDIQNRWVSIGPIPRAKYNDTWRTYHHHVERFYDLLHLSNDLRDLDFKHNLDEKLKLVVRAEKLAEYEDVNSAFKELQILHKLWKEEIGPVARENREEVWGRFSAATKEVHDRRHEFFKDLKSKFEENIEKKLQIILEIDAIETKDNVTRNDWHKSIKEIERLRNKFFDIGRVPKAKSDEIWTKFKEVTRKFNYEKNKFFKEVKKDHLINLNKKKVLIEQAVSLKDSEDWENATSVLKKIQADWKKIGHVPRKYSDDLWKEFKNACNHYFDRLHEKQDAGNKESVEIFNKKKELIKELKEKMTADDDINVETLKAYVLKWRDLGRIPYELRHIEVKFNKLLDKIVEQNSIDKKELEMLKFINLVSSYLDQKNYRKLDSEMLFVRKKIDETNREIQQLENNIGFLSNVSEDNPLVVNVRKQIDVFKEKAEIWKSKLSYMRKLDY